MTTLLQAPPPANAAGLSPLRNGDRLDQPTFHRRYLEMPEDFRAELVGGIVFVSSPATHFHASHHAHVITWLGTYSLHTPGTDLMDNGTVILDEENEPQPDAVLRIEEERGGGSHVNKKGYVTGSPELHVEVAYSSESIDLHLKREEYERTGVREYLVLLVRERQIRGFHLAGGSFVDHPADPDGVWRSKVFPGLWLGVREFFDRRGPALLEVLQTGLKTAGHAEFVERLAKAAIDRKTSPSKGIKG